jgi:hypothetical protein
MYGTTTGLTSGIPSLYVDASTEDEADVPDKPKHDTDRDGTSDDEDTDDDNDGVPDQEDDDDDNDNVPDEKDNDDDNDNVPDDRDTDDDNDNLPDDQDTDDDNDGIPDEDEVIPTPIPIPMPSDDNDTIPADDNDTIPVPTPADDNGTIPIPTPVIRNDTQQNDTQPVGKIPIGTIVVRICERVAGSIRCEVISPEDQAGSRLTCFFNSGNCFFTGGPFYPDRIIVQCIPFPRLGATQELTCSRSDFGYPIIEVGENCEYISGLYTLCKIISPEEFADAYLSCSDPASIRSGSVSCGVNPLDGSFGMHLSCANTNLRPGLENPQQTRCEDITEHVDD